MYKFKILLLLFFIGAATPSYSNHGELSGDPVTPNNTPEKSCTLPAPAGLTVTNVTSNSITVQWLPVIGAAAYHVEAFDAITNAPLGLGVVSLGTIATVTSLPSATLVRVEVAPMCSISLEDVSPNASAVEARTDVIIEIIAAGYDCTNNNSPWTTFNIGTSPQSYPLLANGSYFCEIRKTNTSLFSSFDLETISATPARAEMGPVYIGLGSLTGGGSTASVVNSNNYSICSFRIESVSTNSMTLHILPPVKDLISGYSFRISSCNQGRPGQNGENETLAEDRFDNKNEGLSTISPNPFTDRLQIQFGENDREGDAQVQLYHINGALIQTKKQALAEGNSCELLTETLPAGMYLLRIETPVGSVTRLVTKTGQ